VKHSPARALFLPAALAVTAVSSITALVAVVALAGIIAVVALTRIVVVVALAGVVVAVVTVARVALVPEFEFQFCVEVAAFGGDRGVVFAERDRDTSVRAGRTGSLTVDGNLDAGRRRPVDRHFDRHSRAG